MATTGHLSQEEMEDLKRSIANMVLHDLQKGSEEDKTRVRRSLREKLGDDLPLTGLTDAVKAKRFTWAVFWTVVFLCCVGATVYFLIKVFHEYYLETTATKVKLERQSNYEFPPFILCVDTWLDMEKAEKLGFTKEAIKYALAYLVAPYEIYSTLLKKAVAANVIGEDERPSLTRYRGIITADTIASAKMQFDQAYARQNLTSLVEFFKLISLDMVRSELGADGIKVDCLYCTEPELPKVIIGHDVCYKITLYPIDPNAGHSFGWYEFRARVPDRSSGIQKRRSYWKLYAGQSTKLTQPGVYVSIKNGHTQTVQVSTEHGISLNTLKEPCVEDPNYRRRACSFDCVAYIAKQLKNCTLFNLDTDFNRSLSEYCNVYRVENFVEEMVLELMNVLNMTEEARKEQMKKCECLPECDRWKYRTEVDTHESSVLARERYGQDPENTGKIFFVNGDVMAGGILTLREVDTYSFETLVSNIGGVCGIWIGASVLTFVQLFAFFSKLCVGCGKRHLKPKPKLSTRNREGAPMLADKL